MLLWDWHWFFGTHEGKIIRRKKKLNIYAQAPISIQFRRRIITTKPPSRFNIQYQNPCFQAWLKCIPRKSCFEQQNFHPFSKKTCGSSFIAMLSKVMSWYTWCAQLTFFFNYSYNMLVPFTRISKTFWTSSMEGRRLGSNDQDWRKICWMDSGHFGLTRGVSLRETSTVITFWFFRILS